MSNIGVNLSTGSQPSCFANHAGIWGSSGTDSNSIGHITLGTNSDGNNVFSVRRIFYIYMEMSKSVCVVCLCVWVCVCVWRGFSVFGVILFVTSDSESLADSPYDRHTCRAGQHHNHGWTLTMHVTILCDMVHHITIMYARHQSPSSMYDMIHDKLQCITMMEMNVESMPIYVNYIDIDWHWH